MDIRKIGAFISELRKNNNYTQAELAQSLNVTHQAVSKWERGESLPDIGLLPPAARLLGVTVDELLNGERAIVQKTAAAGAAEPETAAPEQMEAAKPTETAAPHPIAEPTVMAAPQQIAATQPVETEAPQPAAEPTVAAVPQQIPAAEPVETAAALEKPVSTGQRMTLDQVSSLAPFLERGTLEKVVDKVIEGIVEPDKLLALAPFLGYESLDRLVDLVEDGVLHGDVISGLAPFLSRDTLSRLVRRAADGTIDPEQILGLAPFLEQSDLALLIESAPDGLHPGHLAQLAPFLPQNLLEKLILNF